LHKKILLAACLAALALIGGVFYAARTILVHSFANIETDEAHQSIGRVSQALRLEQRHLRAAAADNAEWNETYDFALGHHTAFVSENFSRSGLDALDVQVVWMGDTSGHTLVELSTRGPSGTLTDLNPDVLAQIQKYASVLVPRAGADPTLRLLSLPDGVLLFSAVPVVRSDRSGPTAGTLVFGHYVDAAFIQRLEETSQSLVKLVLLDERGVPTGVVPEAVARWLGAPQDHGDIFVVPAGKDGVSLESYVLLRDVDGRPLGAFSNSVSRASLQLGKRAVMWVVAVLVAAFTLLVGLLLTLLSRDWHSRASSRRQWLDQQRKISRLVQRDVLTGLPNRLHLQKLLPRLMKRTGRDGSRLALLYIDLDHFKNVNDSLGHGSGDKLLTAVANRLRTIVSNHDLVVRMGGDEFAVVATMLPDLSVASSIADRIRKALGVPLDVDGVTLSISSSIGISVYPEDGSDSEQLLKHADIALNHAKECGRANHQFYKSEMNVRLRERLGMERDLREALENNQLSLEYQPCFDLQTLRPVSLEALLRWKTASGTYIPPSRFIPIAEQSGLIVDIGAWVLRTVALQLSEWQRQRVPLIPVSVNISVRQFEHTQLATVVSLLADELGIDANLLHFEITESAAMQNSQQHLGALQALRNLGSRILIDDFGTGYSNLSYLKHLPIDTLKIDRAFVRDMAVDANDAAIVRAIVGVAKSLGLQLVAEGIESAEQLKCLKELGCECGQGFYFSPPVSAESCRAMLWQLRGPTRGAIEVPARLRLLTPT
jgi:diguanylate cyclase (GGDEF)-like protein